MKIIKASLSKGTLPKRLKQAFLEPFLKLARDHVINYGPFSNLSFSGEVIEQVMLA